MQDKVLPQLKQQLADTKGLFKGKERKALEVKIKETETEIADRLDKIPDTLKEDGYPDVQAFMATYRKAEAVVENYNRELAEWERKVREKGKPAEKEQAAPPQKESVLKRLRQLQAEGKSQKPKPKRKTHEHGTIAFTSKTNTAGFLRCIHKECAPWLPSTGAWLYMDLSAVFSLAAVNGCAGQDSARS